MTTHQPAHLRDLDRDRCHGLLSEQRVGRIGFVEQGGQPVILPVTYVMDGRNVLFRTHEGSPLHQGVPGSRVAFEVDGLDPDRRTGWSVLVKGVAEEITDPGELERVQELPLSPWAGPGRTAYVHVVPGAVTGRRVEAGDDLASLWWG